VQTHGWRTHFRVDSLRQQRMKGLHSPGDGGAFKLTA